jgi:hypothetical protein
MKRFQGNGEAQIRTKVLKVQPGYVIMHIEDVSDSRYSLPCSENSVGAM